jgi:hypothetical protein
MNRTDVEGKGGVVNFNAVTDEDLQRLVRYS